FCALLGRRQLVFRLAQILLRLVHDLTLRSVVVLFGATLALLVQGDRSRGVSQLRLTLGNVRQVERHVRTGVILERVFCFGERVIGHVQLRWGNRRRWAFTGSLVSFAGVDEFLGDGCGAAANQRHTDDGVQKVGCIHWFPFLSLVERTQLATRFSSARSLRTR